MIFELFTKSKMKRRDLLQFEDGIPDLRSRPSDGEAQARGYGGGGGCQEIVSLSVEEGIMDAVCTIIDGSCIFLSN